jgi:hypothetical protein
LRFRTSIAALCLFTLCFGCEDLREFKTGPDDIFRGEVVGSDTDGLTGSFIRKGFLSHTMLELRFNPNASGVTVPDDAGRVRERQRSVPGTVHTYVCPDGRAQCDDAERVDGPFSHTQLLPIESLAHDPLSQYTFPGGGRLRNDIYGLRFSSENEQGRVGRDALVFLSLMESGKIELRALAPGVQGDDAETEILPSLFGVFILSR